MSKLFRYVSETHETIIDLTKISYMTRSLKKNTFYWIVFQDGYKDVGLCVPEKIWNEIRDEWMKL